MRKRWPIKFGYQQGQTFQPDKTGQVAPYESKQTNQPTSVVDKDGNAVAVTHTPNTTPSAIELWREPVFKPNNQMDDFSAKPVKPLRLWPGGRRC